MKKMIIALACTAGICATANASIAPPEYVEAALVEICQSIQSDRVYKFQKKLREHRLSLNTVRDKLVCNNESIYDFAITENAFRTAKYISQGKVEIRDIAAVTEDKPAVAPQS